MTWNYEKQYVYIYKDVDTVQGNYCLPLKDFLCILNTHYTYTTESLHALYFARFKTSYSDRTILSNDFTIQRRLHSALWIYV